PHSRTNAMNVMGTRMGLRPDVFRERGLPEGALARGDYRPLPLPEQALQHAAMASELLCWLPEPAATFSPTLPEAPLSEPATAAVLVTACWRETSGTEPVTEPDSSMVPVSLNRNEPSPSAPTCAPGFSSSTSMWPMTVPFGWALFQTMRTRVFVIHVDVACVGAVRVGVVPDFQIDVAHLIRLTVIGAGQVAAQVDVHRFRGAQHRIVVGDVAGGVLGRAAGRSSHEAARGGS